MKILIIGGVGVLVRGVKKLTRTFGTHCTLARTGHSHTSSPVIIIMHVIFDVGAAKFTIFAHLPRILPYTLGMTGAGADACDALDDAFWPFFSPLCYGIAA